MWYFPQREILCALIRLSYKPADGLGVLLKDTSAGQLELIYSSNTEGKHINSHHYKWGLTAVYWDWKQLWMWQTTFFGKQRRSVLTFDQTLRGEGNAVTHTDVDFYEHSLGFIRIKLLVITSEKVKAMARGELHNPRTFKLHLKGLALPGLRVHRSCSTSNFLIPTSWRYNRPAVRGSAELGRAAAKAQLGQLISASRGTLRGLSCLYIEREVFLEPPHTSSKDEKTARQRGHIMCNTGYNAVYTPFNLWNSQPTRGAHKSLRWELIMGSTGSRLVWNKFKSQDVLRVTW